MGASGIPVGASGIPIGASEIPTCATAIPMGAVGIPMEGKKSAMNICDVFALPMGGRKRPTDSTWLFWKGKKSAKNICGVFALPRIPLGFFWKGKKSAKSICDVSAIPMGGRKRPTDSTWWPWVCHSILFGMAKSPRKVFAAFPPSRRARCGDLEPEAESQKSNLVSAETLIGPVC